MTGFTAEICGENTNITVQRIATARGVWESSDAPNTSSGYSAEMIVVAGPDTIDTVLASATIVNNNTGFNWSFSTSQLNALGKGGFIYYFLVTYPDGDVVIWGQGNFTNL